jgi:hypothetical protein
VTKFITKKNYIFILLVGIGHAVEGVPAFAVILVVVGTSAVPGVPVIVGFLGPLALDLLLVSLYLLGSLLLLA